MAKINLRNYHEEIESLINRGRYDEAVAHCRHILEMYPKSVDTYRLLGKAFLEARRYTDAIDIFQRVLSAVPDDFVSHLGLSIIREDEGSLDTAIWHMERAFEIQPYNSAIQEELRRLYERRDGSAPPKIRLTRAALARMYAKGNLYQQAIAETRGILNEDPKRFDLQILLGKMYLKTGKQVEAAEISSKVLNKLPYCLDANLVLVRILKDTEHKQELQLYRDRLSSLNPYESFSSENLPSVDLVSGDTVQLEKLDLAGDQLIATDEKADWMATLGLSSSDFDTQIDEDLPDWLIAASAQIQSDEKTELTLDSQAEASTEDIFAEQEADIDSIEWLGEYEEDLDIPTDQVSTEQAADSEELPDWMRAGGWDTAESISEISELETGTTAGVDAAPIESFEITQDEDLAESTETEAIAQGDIPDWLRDLAPEEIEAVDEEKLPVDAEIDEGFDDKLAALFAAGTVAAIAAEELDQDSLEDELSLDEEIDSELDVSTVEPVLPVVPVDVQADLTPDEEDLPDWLNEFTETDTEAQPASPVEMTSTESADLPEWLIGIEDETVSPEEPEVEAATLDDEDLPEWLREFDQDESISDTTEADASVEIESAPDWLSEISEGDLDVEFAGDTAAEVSTIEEADLVDMTGEAMATEVESAAESVKTGFEEPPDFADADDALAWLAGLAASQEIADTEEQVQAPEEAVESSEILAEAKAGSYEENAEAEHELTAQTEVELESPPDFEDMDAAVAWLAGLAASQPQKEETVEADSSITEKPEDIEPVVSGDFFEEAGGEEPEVTAETPIAQAEAVELDEPLIQEGVPHRAAPIDINAASLVELERLPGVGFRIAQAIVAYRDEHGAFASIEELADVPELDPDDIFNLNKLIVVEGSDEPIDRPPAAKTDQGLLQAARQAVASGELPAAIQQYTSLINDKASLEEVIFDLNRMLQNRPDDIEIWQLLGDAYMRNNQLIEAMQAYNKAEELLR